MKTFKQFVVEKRGPCWPGYEMVGMKKKDGKEVPNCVPQQEAKQCGCSTCSMCSAS